MRLRPHHLLDIITQYGADIPFVPSSYGHAVHQVAQVVLSDPKQAVQLVVGADDVCTPCKNLKDGQCTDTIRTVAPPLAKQAYNDALDRRLLGHLGLAEGQVLRVSDYLQCVTEHLTGLASVCAHPGEDAEERLKNLSAGLQKLGC